MKKFASDHSGIFILRVALALSFLAVSAFLGFLAFTADRENGPHIPRRIQTLLTERDRSLNVGGVGPGPAVTGWRRLA